MFYACSQKGDFKQNFPWCFLEEATICKNGKAFCIRVLSVNKKYLGMYGLRQYKNSRQGRLSAASLFARRSFARSFVRSVLCVFFTSVETVWTVRDGDDDVWLNVLRCRADLLGTIGAGEGGRGRGAGRPFVG